jgi:hypothetical protein
LLLPLLQHLAMHRPLQVQLQGLLLLLLVVGSCRLRGRLV